MEELKIKRITKKVPLHVASAVGCILEAAYRYLPLSGEPRMSRFAAAALAKTHWYDMQPAFDDLGYSIRVPMTDATAATLAWFKEQTP